MSGSLIVAVTSIKLTEMQQTIAKKYPHNDANNAQSHKNSKKHQVFWLIKTLEISHQYQWHSIHYEYLQWARTHGL